MNRRRRFDSQIAILRAALLADPERWWSLLELHNVTGIRETSLSAQLRNLRKKQHGGHAIAKRHRLNGEWEYRMDS